MALIRRYVVRGKATLKLIRTRIKSHTNHGWAGGGVAVKASRDLVPFRVGFDDVINNELSGVFIRNDTNSEVIKLRSVWGSPGMRGERVGKPTVCVRSQIPGSGSKRDFSPLAVRRKPRNGRRRSPSSSGRWTALRSGFSFRGKSAARVNHPCCRINENSGVNLFRLHSCRYFSRAIQHLVLLRWKSSGRLGPHRGARVLSAVAVVCVVHRKPKPDHIALHTRHYMLFTLRRWFPISTKPSTRLAKMSTGPGTHFLYAHCTHEDNNCFPWSYLHTSFCNNINTNLKVFIWFESSNKNLMKQQ